jgi:hypothetical protein
MNYFIFQIGIASKNCIVIVVVLKWSNLAEYRADKLNQ